MANLHLISPRTTIAVIEEDSLTRDCVTSLLRQERDFEVVVSAESIDPKVLAEVQPDVILVDGQLSDATETRLVPALSRAAKRYAKIVATGIGRTHEHLVDLLRAGVSGFVAANATCVELISTIRLVGAGTNVMPPCLLSTLARNLARERAEYASWSTPFPPPAMPDREIVILVTRGTTEEELQARRHKSARLVASDPLRKPIVRRNRWSSPRPVLKYVTMHAP